MILYHEEWDHPIFITKEEPTVLIFPDLLELYNYQKSFLEQLDTGEGFVSIFDDDKPIKIEKDVEYIPNIFTLSLNTRKTINYLHKNIIKETSKTDQAIEFEELKKDLIEWLRSVRKETFIDFSYEKDLEIKNILKLFKVQFKEREDTPGQLLCRYIDLLISMTKIKVVFVSFSSYFLTEEELKHFIDHCIANEIYLILVEKEKPQYSFFSNSISIVDNFVLK